MKVALVYDRVNKWGGAERVLLALHDLYPQAPLYTAVYDPQSAQWAKVFPQVITSFLQRWPLAKKHHELYPWLTPLAFESFDFSGFDLVISVTSAEAKAIITKPQTLHLCYCLTPTRYLWSIQKEYLTEPGLGRWLKPWQKHLQKQDLLFAQRPDKYLAISKTVQQRIKKYYKREAQVIYPPVGISSKSNISNISDYFLVVSRLVNYKKIELAIKVFNNLKLPLVIVGTGREERRLRQLAGPTIRFCGQVIEPELINYYRHCQALIMSQEEDFGITAVEAMACGRPVISFSCGGTAEAVIAGKTGIFFNQQTVDSLQSAVKQFKSRTWDSRLIRHQAEKFNQNIFKQKMKQLVEEQWQTFRSKF